MNIAYVISSHGYGHATRAAAVMAAMQRRIPSCHFHIFTSVAADVFRESLQGPFTQHRMTTDIGVIQKSALDEDLPGTLAALGEFYPLSAARTGTLAAALRAQRCEQVLCDIAPLGIVAAHEAGLPAVLIENFMWDLIYSGYVRLEPRLQPYMDHLAGLFSMADVHIQTRPVCTPVAADLTVDPVSREPRTAPRVTRENLGIPDDRPMILVTMGGLDEDTPFIQRLKAHPGLTFVLPGAVPDARRLAEHVIEIPRHSGVYHPDLVHAADAVVGKLGYSTLAEVYHAGIPFGYVLRDNFSEGRALAAFVEHDMQGLPISAAAFRDGAWMEAVEELAARGRRSPAQTNGADTIAEYLVASRNRAR